MAAGDRRLGFDSLEGDQHITRSSVRIERRRAVLVQVWRVVTGDQGVALDLENPFPGFPLERTFCDLEIDRCRLRIGLHDHVPRIQELSILGFDAEAAAGETEAVP